MRNLAHIALLLCLAIPLRGQIIDNGSLEGEPGTRTPVNWFSCLESSTVDIGPGVWGITLPPQDGDTYINMVCRGPEQPNRGSCEELSQTLNRPLESGKCYRFEVYLAYFPAFLFPDFRNPLDLIINAGRDACSRDLEIGRYTGIDHEEWRRYVTYINPSQDLNGMLLEVNWSSLPTYSGHMLVDNMRVEEISTPPLRELTICEGESLRLDAFEARDASAIAWSTGADSDFIEVTEAGTYTVDVTLGNCVFTETFEVRLQEAPQPFIALTDAAICFEESLLLDLSGEGDSFLWQDGSTDPVFTVTSPGTYSVDITIGSCTTNHRLLVIEDDCPPVIRMPNAFTPNGDGTNETFIPIELDNIREMQTNIYNRWGDLVFETSNLMIEWDGNLPNAEPAPPSTYYWQISYVDLSGRRGNLKGTVTIVK